ncbi:MAG: hypothetical protein IJT05_04570 [Lachnospiraceae bacterium]|nr:hypothetical protein [Lachnospiraceae bacterium]
MSMEINTNYNSYQTAAVNTSSAKVEEKAAEKNAGDVGVTYEKSENFGKATYSINKMSAEDRANLVSQLKADQEKQQAGFLSLVQKTIGGQIGAISMSSEDMWKKLASGDFTVDAATKAKAQEDISEDGYWGVKKTSQRLFDFASALAGDDPEKMKKMQDAMQKGFDQATKTWGKDLPEISGNTLDAANKLFDEYYKSKGIDTQ